MIQEKDSPGSLDLLLLGFDDLVKEAQHAVESKNIDRLHDIGMIVERHFCKKIANHDLEALGELDKCLVNFLAWFEWGGEIKWQEADAIATRWKTILELSQKILQTESPLKAYKEMRKSEKYGQLIISLIHERKAMKPGEIREALNIRSIQQVSKLLSDFEKAGLIVRETDGKNVWVYLGKQGISVYREYISPHEISAELGVVVAEALEKFKNNDFASAKDKLQKISKESPDNPLVVCLLGIIAIEENKLKEAGDILLKAVHMGLDRIRAFMFFYLLKEIGKLDEIKNGIETINFQNDKISRQVRPTMRLLGLLAEYQGKPDRAREYHRLSYAGSDESRADYREN